MNEFESEITIDSRINSKQMAKGDWQIASDNKIIRLVFLLIELIHRYLKRSHDFGTLNLGILSVDECAMNVLPLGTYPVFMSLSRQLSVG